MKDSKTNRIINKETNISQHDPHLPQQLQFKL